jgi:uncharacterized protein (TIGR00730 family)
MRVVVFGGSKPKPEEEAYRQAYQLGRLLGSAGYTVLTGGYIGTMEAVSRGANEAGGHVIGVTCEEIEAYRPGKANPWVQEEFHYPTLVERLENLMRTSDAALALPGGTGTLTEISLVWNHLLVGAIPPRPLILIGPGWKQTFQCFFQSLSDYLPSKTRDWLSFEPDVQSAFRRLQNSNGRR